jgi:hypothetical protein
MKQLLNTKANIRLLEDLVRTMSKGYYSDFKEDLSENTKTVVVKGRGRKKTRINQDNINSQQEVSSEK